MLHCYILSSCKLSLQKYGKSLTWKTPCPASPYRRFAPQFVPPRNCLRMAASAASCAGGGECSVGGRKSGISESVTLGGKGTVER
jgi:hypothetical protein